MKCTTGETATPAGAGSADLQQVERCLAGEREAFGALVHKYRELVYRFSYRVCGSREQAEDITQESFVRAYQALPSLRRKAAFKSWLLRIALNLCRDASASRSATARYETLMVSATQENIADRRPDPEQAYARQVARESLWRALGRLSATERALFVMKYVEGMSYAEIREASGALTTGLLKLRLYRVREKLSRYLSRKWGGGNE